MDHPHHEYRVLAKCSERHDGARLLTVRLINDRRAESVSERQHNALHQARIELKGSFADVRGFVGRRESDMNLLYHDSRSSPSATTSQWIGFLPGMSIQDGLRSTRSLQWSPGTIYSVWFRRLRSSLPKNGSKNCLLLAGSLLLSMKRGGRGRLILFLVQI